MKKTLQISILAIITYASLSFMGLTNTIKISKYKATPPRLGGAAAVLGSDKTGSPLSGGGKCTDCHGPSNANTSLLIQMFDNTNTAVTEYSPGNLYTLKVTVSTTGALSKFGSQAVILDALNTNAGNMGSPTSAVTQVTTLGSVQYLEHNSTLVSPGSYTYVVPWTAPNSGTGNVTVYGMGMVVNGNGVTSGDEPSSPQTLQLTEVVPISINYLNNNYCNNSMNETPTITGANGGVFTSLPAGLNINSSTGEIDFSNSATGNYTVTYTVGIDMTTAIVKINSTYNTTDAFTLCSGDSYSFGSQTLNASNAGTNTETFQSISGCDSIVTLTLSVINPSINNITTTICNGETYNFEGQILDASNIGLNTVVLDNASANGCDSTINLTLSVTSIDNSISVINNSFMSNQNGATYQWLNCNGGTYTPIADSTNQTLIPGNSDFSYAVEVSFNGCVDTSVCLTQLSIDANLFDLITIFPNPTSDYLKINGVENINSISKIYILDNNGKKVMTITDFNSYTKIDIKHLPVGIYRLNIIKNNEIKQFKFIKQ